MGALRRIVVVAGWSVVVFAIAVPATRAETTPPAGSWVWPVRGPVIRGYEPPPTPFSPGHRGIDIATPFGTPVRAPADGVVSFAGTVAGAMFVTIDHGDGYRSTSSWLAQLLVAQGHVVHAGDAVALSGRGHPEIDTPHLHFGVRLNGDYVDPLPLLGSESVVGLIRLAPLEDSQSRDETPLPPSARWAVRDAARVAFLHALLLRDRLASGVASASAYRPWSRSPPGGPLE